MQVVAYMRVLRNSAYERWLQAGKPAPGHRPGEHDIVAQSDTGSPIERYSRSLPALTMVGDLEPLANYAGQSAGLVTTKKSTYEILDEIIADAMKRIRACQMVLR